ncbi:MAG: ABC transporter permease [Chloroflexota bacterium]
MPAILTIAFNQVRSTLVERGSLISLIAVPLVMMIFLGSAVNGSAPTGEIYDVVRSHDPNDVLALQLVALLRADGEKQIQGKDRFIVCDLAQPADQPEPCKLSSLKSDDDLAAFAKQRVDDSTVKASISLPADFTNTLRSGKTVNVTVDAQGGPTAAQSIQQQVAAVSARLSGSILAARIVTDKAKGDSTFYDKVYAAADSVWAKDPVQINETFSTSTGTAAGTGFGQSGPGIGAMFVLINALILAEVFITERRQGTLQRLMVLPISRTQVLAGKLLGQYLLCLLIFAVMLVAGSIFGVQWGDPLGVVAIVLVYTLAVTAMGLWFSTVAKTDGQANGLRLLAAMILAPLGGAWWTLAIVPAWMQSIGRISPIYWSQDAFTKMIFYGAHLVDILPSIGVLLVFAAVFFALGVSRFRYE